MLDKDASQVHFHFLEPGSIKNRNKLKAFIPQLFLKEKKTLATLQYIFCSDQYLLAINKEFLRHDYYTDIITFPISKKGYPIEGEIYISLDRVKDNACQLGEHTYRELHRVIFHGALHLCGYKDKTKKEALLMRKKEEYYLNGYFL